MKFLLSIKRLWIYVAVSIIMLVLLNFVLWLIHHKSINNFLSIVESELAENNITFHHGEIETSGFLAWDITGYIPDVEFYVGAQKLNFYLHCGKAEMNSNAFSKTLSLSFKDDFAISFNIEKEVINFLKIDKIAKKFKIKHEKPIEIESIFGANVFDINKRKKLIINGARVSLPSLKMLDKLENTHLLLQSAILSFNREKLEEKNTVDTWKTSIKNIEIKNVDVTDDNNPIFKDSIKLDEIGQINIDLIGNKTTEEEKITYNIVDFNTNNDLFATSLNGNIAFEIDKESKQEKKHDGILNLSLSNYPNMINFCGNFINKILGVTRIDFRFNQENLNSITKLASDLWQTDGQNIELKFVYSPDKELQISGFTLSQLEAKLKNAIEEENKRINRNITVDNRINKKKQSLSSKKP